MIDLAGIMGLHSLINQEQYHAATKAGQYVGIGIPFRRFELWEYLVLTVVYNVWIKNFVGKKGSGSILLFSGPGCDHKS